MRRRVPRRLGGTRCTPGHPRARQRTCEAGSKASSRSCQHGCCFQEHHSVRHAPQADQHPPLARIQPPAQLDMINHAAALCPDVPPPDNRGCSLTQDWQFAWTWSGGAPRSNCSHGTCQAPRVFHSLGHGLQLGQECRLRAREPAQAALQRVPPWPRRHRAIAVRLRARVPGPQGPFAAMGFGS